MSRDTSFVALQDHLGGLMRLMGRAGGFGVVSVSMPLCRCAYRVVGLPAPDGLLAAGLALGKAFPASSDPDPVEAGPRAVTRRKANHDAVLDPRATGSGSRAGPLARPG